MKSNTNKYLFFVICLLFIISFGFCFYSVITLLKYSVILQHDQTIAFHRTFFNPEHGRYLSTFLINLLTEKVPKLLNIHPNDIHCTVTPIVKAFFICIICSLFSCSIYIFTNLKKENKIILSFSFLLFYMTIFLSLFNNNYFFFSFSRYFNSLENMVFFEYPFSFLFYIPFMCIFFYFNRKNSCSKIPKKWMVLWCVITFFLGLTVELVIFPILFFITITFLYYFYKYKKNKTQKNKNTFFNITTIFVVYIISTIIYLHRGNDTTIIYQDGFFNYVKDNFTEFCSFLYLGFIVNSKVQLISLLVLIFIVLIFRRKNQQKNIEFSFFAILNILGMLLYICSSFLFGKDVQNDYFFLNPKWVSIYRCYLLFIQILTLGYVFNSVKFLEKNSSIIKIAFSIIILILYFNTLLFNYVSRIKAESASINELRKIIYMTEKNALSSNLENIQIPVQYENKCIYYDACYIEYFRNVQQEHFAEKKKVEFINNMNFDEKLFSDEELKELKFTNL